MRKWWIIWPLFFAVMGFFLGASFFFGFYGRNVTESKITAHEKHEPAAEEAKSKKEETDDALAYYTLWLMGFTGVLAFATIGLGIATVMLYGTGERQFKLTMRSGIRQGRDTKAALGAATEANRIVRENAVADRRAWIDISDVTLLGPQTGFLEDLFTFKIQYTLKNLGRTLARSVEIDIETWYAENSTEQFPAARNRILEKARQKPIELGFTLFPNDPATGSLLFADGAEKFSGAIKTRPDGSRKFGVSIFVTVSYRIDGDNAAVHVTQYIFDTLNMPVPTTIPDGRAMTLQPLSFLAPIID